MGFSTEQIMESILAQISAMEEVQAIGISGSGTNYPKAGEGDIDVFIYCRNIPAVENRHAIIGQMEGAKINVFESSNGHWGTGDFVLVNGVETWLMYFAIEENDKDIEAILSGEYPDKLDNYYYPIGRCAMLKSITILYDKGYLGRLKDKLEVYPEALSEKLFQYHREELEDVEDLERATSRKDVLFYHFALDLAIDHFLQALFALNKAYFPSRKRTIEHLEHFELKPRDCSFRLLEVIKLGAAPESIGQSYEEWRGLVAELNEIGTR